MLLPEPSCKDQVNISCMHADLPFLDPIGCWLQVLQEHEQLTQMTLELGQVKREREHLASELQAARQLAQSPETADVAVQARCLVLSKGIDARQHGFYNPPCAASAYQQQ